MRCGGGAEVLDVEIIFLTPYILTAAACLQVAPGATQGPRLPLGWHGAGQLAGPGPGILEVKCPYNKGRPELASPPPTAIWYYMPQVGLVLHARGGVVGRVVATSVTAVRAVFQL